MFYVCEYLCCFVYEYQASPHHTIPIPFQWIILVLAILRELNISVCVNLWRDARSGTWYPRVLTELLFYSKSPRFIIRVLWAYAIHSAFEKSRAFVRTRKARRKRTRTHEKKRHTMQQSFDDIHLVFFLLFIFTPCWWRVNKDVCFIIVQIKRIVNI